jgi:hypothetical protein
MRPSFGPVKPSYSFLAVYERGAVLRRHTDREQCAWNLSVALGSEPHLPVDRQWPLHIETASGRHAVRLGPGDAVVYSGSDSPHWRDELQSIDSVTVAFCHFVDAAYEGPLC